MKSIDQRLSTLKKLQEALEEKIEKHKSELYGGKVDVQKVSSSPVSSDKVNYLKKRDALSDKQFFKSIKGKLEQIPDSNGSRYFEKMDVNIGIIADEFLFNSYKDIANFHYITRDNYKKYRNRLDVFMVVSTWKGLNNEWKGLGNPNILKHRKDLKQIIDYYRAQGTKIVFYSKEDPVNYEIFINIAKECDYVFTTAAEKIEDYKKDCNNDKVYLLNFGINPLYHNPIGIKKFPKQREVLFTGSWYEKYPIRQMETKAIFDGVLKTDRKLKIIDRNYDLNLEAYFFPEKYLPYVSPAIHHEYLQKLHKLYDFSINLNTVKYSKTMFANRIYELQALGNILISNYSVGVNDKFPNVFITNSSNEVRDILTNFEDTDIYKQQIAGIRKVMSNETSFNRISEMLEKIGVSYKVNAKKVAVLVTEKTETAKKLFEVQSYPHKELFTVDEFNEGLKRSFDMIAFLDDNCFYGEYYLEDLINGFKYTDSDYITKDVYYSGESYSSGIEFDYTSKMPNKFRTVFWSNAFTYEQLLNYNKDEQIPNGFSIDRFEYNEHLPEQVETKKQYKLSVIIPTYNNGEHLQFKCFNSLKRSSMFSDMEIIIVDDGSTEEDTIRAIERLARENQNVKTYFYEQGGSGSASRPRNKGFELSTAPYITYLDPDNEAVNDGYFALYKELENNDYDLVVGNMWKFDNQKEVLFDYYKTAIQMNGDDVIESNHREYLINSQFKAMSIQALIVKREVIQDNHLTMVEGAAGEDTLFFHELLLNSDRIKVIDLPIHIYYAAVTGSTVNSISKKFFEKYLILERSRAEFLRNKGIMNDYMNKRFEYYFENWYLVKLKNVSSVDAKESIILLSKILDLYKDDFKPEDNRIKRFLLLAAKKKYEVIEKEYIG